mmetsp:Transcript_21240/g.49449  ORF Transcript_21240/g.49449 Transcript_21240/m.49449 type:complete len:500 (+) Transcript_21240:79-1578(+)|eukprot:CAMPEP_0171072986 /NCGR_PEP_ID=MMETSP0766_2-20121228/11216_1 /TAXON_ID=439317 /ORGANISM="Gambierdiscus australes, Strain CAWD 149" /LENGTH=499 /DNA_ID=CAMNT_0011529633 /DNA_START=67 /DNA_END=1566 /DNA_ORIENTATION=+
MPCKGARRRCVPSARTKAAGFALVTGSLVALSWGDHWSAEPDWAAFAALRSCSSTVVCSPLPLTGLGLSLPSPSAAVKAPAVGVGRDGTGSRAASLNLAKNLVGSGILSLPAGVAAFSASREALGPALLLLVVAALLSAYGFFLIGRVCEETRTTTFGGAWEQSIGRGAWVPRLTCLLECLGGSIVYAMVLGDVFSSLLHSIGGLPPFLCARSSVICLIASVLLFPLCCLRTFGQLAKFSALGTLASSFVVLFVVKRFVDGTYGLHGRFQHSLTTSTLVSAGGVLSPRVLILASILSTAFLVHFNAPQMYAELKPRKQLDDAQEEAAAKQKRFGAVALAGFSMATVQYALVMVFGFLTFGHAAEGNVLLNYSTSDSWAVAARIAIGISTLFGYPMQFAGLRSGLLEALGRQQPLSTGLHRLLTAGLLFMVVCVSCTLRDLGKFQAVEGALLASFLIYIAPPMMAFKLGKGLARRTRYVLVMLFGVVVSVVGCVVTVLPP